MYNYRHATLLPAGRFSPQLAGGEVEVGHCCKVVAKVGGGSLQLGEGETLRRKVLSKLRADIILDAVMQPETAKSDRFPHLPRVGVSSVIA